MLSNNNVNENLKSEVDSHQHPAGRPVRTWAGLIVFAILFVTACWILRQYFDLDLLAERELYLKELLAKYPVLFFAGAFLVYTTFTGLSVPGASVLSLSYAWFFGFWKALLLVSFASTAGATIAFLISRHLASSWVERRWGDRMLKVNEAIEREGAFYLFSLRLMAVIPFLVVNLVMGLTKMKTWTYWWVSQIGMLPVTSAYIYAGSSVPSLTELRANGVSSIISPTQLTQLLIACSLIGLLPLVIKKLMERFRREKPSV